MGLVDLLSRWARLLRRPRPGSIAVSTGWRQPYPTRVSAAYARSCAWGERLSYLYQEPVTVPAYEARARRGERAPARFGWRGDWFLVTDVVGTWSDGRPPTSERPEFGRVYYVVETRPVGLYQIYFERPRERSGPGRWMVYRRIQIRARVA